MSELDNELYSKMTALTDEGNELQSTGKLPEAKEKFKDAFRLLPSNYEEWEAATWILLAIGDVCFLMQEYSEAQENL